MRTHSMMRFVFAALVLACCPIALAGDTVDHTDARDRPELGHQIKQAKQEMRRERKAARARFYAARNEERARELRAEEKCLEAANHPKAKETAVEK